MALYKSELMTGSGLSETLIWGGSARTSMSSNSRILTNSDFYTLVVSGNYKYLKFVWRPIGSDSSLEFETIVSADQIFCRATNASYCVVDLSGYKDVNYYYTRRLKILGTTDFTADVGKRWTSSGYSDGSSYAVPQAIYGLK